MPINNLRNEHLESRQVEDILDAISVLETQLAGVQVDLTPEDRKRYGSINEQNKLLVNRVKDFRTISPELSDPDADWTEFERDYTSRQAYEGIINRLQAIILNLKNAKILHDHDNYHTALDDYGYTSYKAGGGSAAYESKKNELKQFFGRGVNNPPPTPDL